MTEERALYLARAAIIELCYGDGLNAVESEEMVEWCIAEFELTEDEIKELNFM